ncbi:unnamed protein product [Lactuca virosa]|uniref:Uncharacterized protein n=1 Tax=Lactuca virosa TaxID=75947 RepID=A0AAU9ML92_9ASTR|nr:unnamed protein product [Lactuca virosa]
MMRKSHVRSPRRECYLLELRPITTGQFPLWGHPLLYHYYRGMGFETKKDQGSISAFPLYFTWICFYAISYSVDSFPNRNHRFTNLLTTEFSERRPNLSMDCFFSPLSPPSKCLWYQFIFGYPKLM